MTLDYSYNGLTYHREIWPKHALWNSKEVLFFFLSNFAFFNFWRIVFRHFGSLPCKVNGSVSSLLLLEFSSDFDETWRKSSIQWANIGLCFFSRFSDFYAFRGTLTFNMGVYRAKSCKSLLLWDLRPDFDKTWLKRTLQWSDTGLCFLAQLVTTSWGYQIALASVVLRPSSVRPSRPISSTPLHVSSWNLTKICLFGFPGGTFFFFFCKVNASVFLLLLLEFWSDFDETWHKSSMPWANIGVCLFSRFTDFDAFCETLNV